jgi:hypothetical protein
MENVMQIEIRLKGSEPLIWRRVLVPDSLTFTALHFVMQIAMGWENHHLYDFKVKKIRICEPEPDWDDEDSLDASMLTIGDFFEKKKTRFEYEYDFGDGWIHDLKIEKYLQPEPGKIYPVCTGGEMACPPEDCGGIWGYYDLLKIVNSKKHPEKEEMREWLGEDFDPTYINIEEINADLAKFGKVWSTLNKKGQR